MCLPPPLFIPWLTLTLFPCAPLGGVQPLNAVDLILQAHAVLGQSPVDKALLARVEGWAPAACNFNRDNLARACFVLTSRIRSSNPTLVAKYYAAHDALWLVVPEKKGK